MIAVQMETKLATVAATMPEPSERERQAITEARVRRVARRPRLGARMHMSGKNNAQIGPDHADATGWSNRVLDVMGTSSGNFACTEIDNLATALNTKDGARLSAGLAVLDGARPKDEIEAQLISHGPNGRFVRPALEAATA